MGLSYEDLLTAVSGEGVGIRARTALEPLGGPGDKVFPPTYAVGDAAETRYAVEQRRVGDQTVRSVVLDSVASQANRFESALLDAHRRGELRIPLVSVDFRDADGIEGLDRISSLEAPHRIFDAILRDSLDGDRLFRLGETGQSITEATSRNAAAIFRYSPHTLVFGGWDSTGPRGGRGAKYERALTSEVVATGIEMGKKTASRIDPLAIELKAGTVFEGKSPAEPWTLDETAAITDAKGNPVAIKDRGEGGAGRPSQINHGNVAPSIDEQAGGVTADAIHATTVLSLVQLRRLRFPRTTSGEPIADERRPDAETAARAALAALGLAAVVLAFDEGLDLRSRCVLVATEALTFELLGRARAAPRSFTLDRDEVLALVESACAGAVEAGLEWEADEVLLTPIDGLVQLVRNSQEIAATSPES